MAIGFEGEADYRVLGVYGGPGGTVAALANGRGEVLGCGLGAPADPLAHPVDEAQLRATLLAAIESARLDAGDADLGHVLVVRLGMIGSSTLAAKIVSALLPYARTISESHASSTLASVTFGGPGVCVIAGEGSVSFGRCPQGREVSIGGWGPAMGDEGSDDWIARRALAGVTKAADGRGEPTGLTACLLKQWGAPNLQELHKSIQSPKFDRSTLATGASVVGAAAREGDALALWILGQAALELASLATTALRRLSMEGPVVVGVVGGAFHAGPPLMTPFEAAVRRAHPEASIVIPEAQPVLGALTLALMDLEVEITPEIRGRLLAGRERVAQVSM